MLSEVEQGQNTVVHAGVRFGVFSPHEKPWREAGAGNGIRHETARDRSALGHVFGAAGAAEGREIDCMGT